MLFGFDYRNNLFFFHFYCDSLLNSLETKFSFVHALSEKWDLSKELSVDPIVSIHVNMNLTLTLVGWNFFYILFAFLVIEVLSKKAKVSVLWTRLGRMNSTMSGHFSTGKSKELAVMTSASALSLCQDIALQIEKCILLNITLISWPDFSTLYCQRLCRWLASLLCLLYWPSFAFAI